MDATVNKQNVGKLQERWKQESSWCY